MASTVTIKIDPVAFDALRELVNTAILAKKVAADDPSATPSDRRELRAEIFAAERLLNELNQ